MKKCLFILFFFFCVTIVNSQIYIGKSKAYIEANLPKDIKGFSLSSFGINPKINSIKFVDTRKDKTIIFYFNDKNICTYYKLIEDIGEYNKRTEQLNNDYKNVSNDKWLAHESGKNFKISIEKSEWILTVLYTD